MSNTASLLRAQRFSSLVVALCAAFPLAAQCGTDWVPGQGLAGTDGWVYDALWWDPDGPGPRGLQMVVVGSFERAGTVPARSIAGYDLASRTWEPIGPPISNQPVFLGTVVVASNGRLVVGGFDNPYLHNLTGGVYEFDGASWAPLGGVGVNASVGKLVVLPNGDLFVGGDFTMAGGAPANHVARWDGTAWHAYGSSTFGYVGSAAVLANGDIVVGEHTAGPNPGQIQSASVQRWDGSSWSTLTPADHIVRALTVMPNGDLIVGGRITVPGVGVARWDGASWSSLGGGVSGANQEVWGACVLTNGDLVAVGSFLQAGGTVVANAARWNGTNWTSLGVGVDDFGFCALELPTGEIAVGGNITEAGNLTIDHVALWDGTAWSAPGAGLDDPVRALCALPDGDVVGGGSFHAAGGTTVDGVGRWHVNAWQPIGAGVAGGSVHAVVALAGGDIVAAGDFTSAGGAPASCIARWNGAAWAPLGSGLGGGVAPIARAIAVLPNGDVVVAGTFTTAGGLVANAIARWSGGAWSPLGSGLQNLSSSQATVYALAMMANGDLVAAGQLELAGGAPASGIARWNGSSWSAMPGLAAAPAQPIVRALAVLPNGDLVAGGVLGSPLNSVKVWTGGSWSAMGTVIGDVQSLLALPNGDVLAGGVLPPSQGLLRLHNGSWSPFAPGNPMQAVRALVLTADGRLAVGADFGPPSGAIQARFNVLAPTCAPAAIATGSGCTGTGGANVLASETLPWLGGVYRGRASGLAPTGLALAVRGLAPTSLPLAAILPQGLLGCDLLVAPVVLEAAVIAGGGISTQLAIPNTPAIAQLTLLEQVVALEIGAAGAITALTSTNALALTIGSW